MEIYGEPRKHEHTFCYFASFSMLENILKFNFYVEFPVDFVGRWMRLHVALEINVVALFQVSNRKWSPKQVVRKILKWLPEHVFTKIFDTQKWPPNTWSRKYLT